MRTSKYALWLGAALVLVSVLWSGPALADRVHLANGRIHEGKVIAATDEMVQLEKRIGEMTMVVTFRRDEVVDIEYKLTAGQKLAKALNEAKTAEECLTAARQAQAEGVAAETLVRAYERAVELDDQNEEARKALGHVYKSGRWMTDREWKKSQGYIEYKGELVHPDELARVKAQEKDAARIAAEKSQNRVRLEYQGVGWGEAHVIETAHYIVKCNSTKEVAQSYANFMEKIYKAYDKVFKGYKHYWTGKSTIYVFRNIKDFQKYLGVGEGVGGFYRPKSENLNAYPDRMVAAFHGTFGTTGGTREVLAHECTHQIQHILSDGDERQFLSRPTWWMEGLAVYFGDGFTFDKRGQLVVEIPRDRLMWIQRMLKSGQSPKISEFLRIGLRQYQAQAGMTYPYGWSLVYYFMHRGEDRKGRQQSVKIGSRTVNLEKTFQSFFKVVTERPPASVDLRSFPDYYARKFDELLGFPVDELTDDWKQFVLGLELKRLGKVKGDKFTADELGMELTKPKGWEWREDDVEGREAIRLENSATTARVIVTAMGNMDNLGTEDAGDFAERMAGAKLDSPMIEERNTIEVGGFPAVEIFYSGTEVKPAHATSEIQVRQNEQMHRHVVIATLKRVYHIVCQADSDRWEEAKDSFGEVLRGLKILSGQD